MSAWFTSEFGRQESEGQPGKFEDFKIPYHRGANVISCLMEVQRNPVTSDGKKTSPVVWDSACLEEVCGSCAMNVNGHVRMACSTLVDKLPQPITLEPMKKFKVVRDLTVNRDRMFDALKRVKAWVQLDGTHNLGPGPRMSQEEQAERYVLSTCITCGSCLEACPQISVNNNFPGRRGHQPSSTFQPAPHGADERHGAVARPHGRGRDSRLWQGSKLRAGLPQGDSADQLHHHDEPRGDEAGGEGLFVQGH